MLRIQIGNLATLRRRRSLCLAEAHHIILVQLLKENQGVKKAVEAGFDFNGIINGLPLEKYVAATGKGRHAHHPEYTRQILRHLENWADLNIGYLPIDAKNKLISLSDDIRRVIINDPNQGRINILDLGL